MASPPSATYRLRKLARRYRGPLIAAAVVLLALVAGLTATLIERDRARENEHLAVLAAGQAKLNAEAAARHAARADRERREAERARRVALQRMVTLAARQGHWQDVLSNVDSLLASSDDEDERARLLVTKLRARTATGDRDCRDIYDDLKSIEPSAATTTETMVWTAYARATTGSNWRKTRREFEGLLGRADLTPGQRELCLSMTVLSPIEASQHLRRVLDLEGYDDIAIGLLGIIAQLTCDEDLLLELLGRIKSVRPNDLQAQTIQAFLAVARREPLPDHLLVDYPEFRTWARETVATLNQFEGALIRLNCHGDAEVRRSASKEMDRLKVKIASLQRQAQEVVKDLTTAPVVGMGIPFIGYYMSSTLQSIRPREGVLADILGKTTTLERIEEETERIAKIPFQQHFVQRAAFHMDAWNETGQVSHLVAAIDDFRSSLTATPAGVSLDLTALLAMIPCQCILLTRAADVEEPVRSRARRELREAARSLLRRPSAGPVLYRWLVLRALDAGDLDLGVEIAERWAGESPDDADAWHSLGWLEFREGGFDLAYLHATKALRLGHGGQSTRELRSKAWEKIGFVGGPANAVLKGGDAEPPSVENEDHR